MSRYRSQRDRASGGGPSDPMSIDSPPEDPDLYLSPYNSSGMNDPQPSTPGSSKKSSASKKSTDNGSTTIVEDRLNDVRTYFANAGLRWRKNIAIGNHGGTLLFDKFDEDEENGPTLQKSLVVKYALDTEPDASTNNDLDLSNEMFWLEKFVNAEHIIQVDPDYRKLWYEDQAGGGAGEVLKRPVIVMEYMEHGTLSELKHRFRNAGLRVPDRMVWHFAYCLIRALIAMAYRDQFKGTTETKRETLPDYDEEEGEKPSPSTLSQYSMKGLNVLVADLIPGDDEHDLVPLLKLIDFGRGLEVGPDAAWGDKIGIAANLSGVAYILSDILHPIAQDQDGWVRWDCANNDVFDPCRIRTTAELDMLNNNAIHRLLRDTLAFFCAAMPKQLPDLYSALELVQAGVREIKTSTNPLNSDEAIRDLVQRLVFDADYDPVTFDFDFVDEWYKDQWNRGDDGQGDRMDEDGDNNNNNNNNNDGGAGPSGGGGGGVARDGGNTGGGGGSTGNGGNPDNYDIGDTTADLMESLTIFYGL
ncbi:hypothetical protein PG984_000129 [Apiospora sp. TS-2023a]